MVSSISLNVASDQRGAVDQARTGRSPKVDKHAVRKQQTRVRLLSAARKLIGQGKFLACSVDELCQVAEISRAGFYLHFTNKQAVLDALQEEMCDWYSRQFGKLTAAAAGTEEGLVAWLAAFVHGFEVVKHAIMLFSEDANLARRGAVRRTAAVLTLGGQVPAFRLIRADGSLDEERRLGLLLLIYQVEQLSLHLVLDGPEDRELPLRVLARQFLHFMAPA